MNKTAVNEAMIVGVPVGLNVFVERRAPEVVR